MENKFNNIGGIVIGVFLIFAIVYIIYKGNEFKKNFKITLGRVTEITGPGLKSSGDYSVLYEFEVNHKKYYGNNNLNFCGGLRKPEIRQLIVNRVFPVAYDVKSPGVSGMILSRKLAGDFRYKIPDTLLPYISKLTCDYK